MREEGVVRSESMMSVVPGQSQNSRWGPQRVDRATQPGGLSGSSSDNSMWGSFICLQVDGMLHDACIGLGLGYVPLGRGKLDREGGGETTYVIIQDAISIQRL